MRDNLNQNGFLYFLLFSIFLDLNGCSESRLNFEDRVESLLLIDVPNNFEIVHERKLEAVGGDKGLEFILQFEDKECEYLFGKINLKNWKEINQGFYSINFSDDTNSVEQIFFRVDSCQLKYLYYED